MSTESRALYDQQPHRRHPQSPTWRDFNICFGEKLPHARREWLLDNGSLTRRLVKKSKGEFAVSVISQRWMSAQRSEYRLLKIPPKERCLVREVLLLCHQQPWVYARSALPETSLTGELRHLRHFDNRPLGQLLFNTPGLKRSNFEIARLSRRHLPQAAQQAVEDKEAILWGRRSRFVLYNKPLLVSEIFLPAFQA